MTRPKPAAQTTRDDRARFVATFALVAGILFTAYYLPRSPADAIERWLREYLALYARVASVAIRVFDPHASVTDNTIAGRFSMQVVKSCDAMEANILFVAAMAATPAPWRRKLVALPLGLLALVSFNILRLFTLYWTGVYAEPVFDFMHYDLWPLLMIAFALLDFLFCVRWEQRGRLPMTASSGPPHVAAG